MELLPFFISLLCVRNQMNFMARANQILKESLRYSRQNVSHAIYVHNFFLLTCFAVSRILIGRISFCLLPPHYVKKNQRIARNSFLVVSLFCVIKLHICYLYMVMTAQNKIPTAQAINNSVDRKMTK